jgi:hypothetical protein
VLLISRWISGEGHGGQPWVGPWGQHGDRLQRVFGLTLRGIANLMPSVRYVCPAGQFVKQKHLNQFELKEVVLTGSETRVACVE